MMTKVAGHIYLNGGNFCSRTFEICTWLWEQDSRMVWGAPIIMSHGRGLITIKSREISLLTHARLFVGVSQSQFFKNLVKFWR